MTAEVVLFPPTKHKNWRTIEATALRIAGGSNTSVKGAVAKLAFAYSNLPSGYRAQFLEAVEAHMFARIKEHRAAVGNTPFETLDEPAEVVPLRVKV